MAFNFSPLFIGESSLTQPAIQYHAGHAVHFSPLFIGESSLTLHAIGMSRPARCNFSPLFIGESSLTQPGRRQAARSAAFQSPLHRGVLFNRAGAATFKRSINDFSPLFIGESSLTGQTWSAWQVIDSISVPSSSGSPL